MLYKDFRRASEIAKSGYWIRHLCLCVCPSDGTTRLPLNTFSWHLMFEDFSKISWKLRFG